jgi:hypothetical protein
VIRLQGEYSHLRAWVRRREGGVYPTTEELLVVAQDVVEDKVKAGFEAAWWPLRVA